jgi:hypothetical protein
VAQDVKAVKDEIVFNEEFILYTSFIPNSAGSLLTFANIYRVGGVGVIKIPVYIYRNCKTGHAAAYLE